MADHGVTGDVECLACGWRGKEAELRKGKVDVEQEDWAGTMESEVCPRCGSAAWEPCD